MTYQFWYLTIFTSRPVLEMYRIFALIICDSVLQRLSFCTNILMVTWGCKKWLTASISLESTLSKTAKCNLYILILYLISMEWGMHFIGLQIIAHGVTTKYSSENLNYSLTFHFATMEYLSLLSWVMK